MIGNLLNEPLFRAADHRGLIHKVSLPELLELLGSDGVASYAAQDHQKESLHIFLCQLAFHALDIRGEQRLDQPADFWREALRALTSGKDEGWCLVVTDTAEPAFMQPPTAQMKEYKPGELSPDELDTLSMAKNHDAKMTRLHGAGPGEWALALISIQTAGGNLGVGTHPISRMNGGYGCRISVGCYQSLSADQRWREDVDRLLKNKDALLTSDWPYQDAGERLLWTLPWDDDRGIPMDRLHPYYIEVCRRRRLVETNTGWVCHGRGSKAVRIAGAGDLFGAVGDPWIPVNAKTGKSVTPPPTGFSAKLLNDLIFGSGDIQRSAMQSMKADGRPAWFQATVLIRGQGKTEGFHEVRLRIPGKAKSLLMSSGAGKDSLSDLSQWGLDRASKARTGSLRPAIFSLLQGGPDGWPDTNARSVDSWVSQFTARFDQQWEHAFFSWLWDSVGQDEATAKDAWIDTLTALSASVLKEATEIAPQKTGQRYRGRMRAESLLYNTLRKNLPKELSHDGQ